MPVHLNLLLMALPYWRWKNLLRLLEGFGSLCLRLHRPERVLRDEYILDIGILVRKVIGSGLEILGRYTDRAKRHQGGGYKDSSHFFTIRLIARAMS